MHGLFRVAAVHPGRRPYLLHADQIESEIIGVINLTFEIYRAFGFKDCEIELSTKPEKHIGSDEIWEIATNALKAALEHKGIAYQINEGDGAFYGPKIDFHIQDCLEPLLAARYDPARFLDARAVWRAGLYGQDNTEKTPVMIHRAVLGSLERFMGILIEHYAGALPLWLSPEQVRVMPISEKTNEYAAKVRERLVGADLRGCDLSDEKIGAKIAKGTVRNSPTCSWSGPKEAEAGMVNLRTSRVNSTWIVTPVGPDTTSPLLLVDGGVHGLPPLSLTLAVMRSASELPGVISGDRSIANRRSAPSATAIEDRAAEVLVCMVPSKGWGRTV